jgi:hypothetical protein
MFIQVSDEASLMLFENVRTEYQGLMMSDFDASAWTKWANVLNVVKLRDDMVDDYVTFRGPLVFFTIDHVEAVYHRNGLRNFQIRLEQSGNHREHPKTRKTGRRGIFSRKKTGGCRACNGK